MLLCLKFLVLGFLFGLSYNVSGKRNKHAVGTRRQYVCPVPIDFGLIIDASGTITDAYLQKVKELAATVVNSFAVSKDMTHVGVVYYSDSAHVAFNFDKFKGNSITKENIIKEIKKIKNADGEIQVDLALKLADIHLFSLAGGSRTQNPKVVLLILGARRTEDLSSVNKIDVASKTLKAKGVKLYVLTISKEFYGNIADDNIFRSKTFNGMSEMVGKVSRKICKDSLSRNVSTGTTKTEKIQPSKSTTKKVTTTAKTTTTTTATTIAPTKTRRTAYPTVTESMDDTTTVVETSTVTEDPTHIVTTTVHDGNPTETVTVDEITSVMATPVITTPTPVMTAPATITPAMTTTVTTTPLTTAPLMTTVVTTSPVMTTPVMASPVMTTPMMTTPIVTIPVITAPVATPEAKIPVIATPAADILAQAMPTPTLPASFMAAPPAPAPSTPANPAPAPTSTQLITTTVTKTIAPAAKTVSETIIITVTKSATTTSTPATKQTATTTTETPTTTSTTTSTTTPFCPPLCPIKCEDGECTHCCTTQGSVYTTAPTCPAGCHLEYHTPCVNGNCKQPCPQSCAVHCSPWCKRHCCNRHKIMD